MVRYQQQFYLVIRPLSEYPAMVEPYLDTLSGVSGLDISTLRQKFTGTALQVLKVGHDQREMETISGELNKKGLISTVIAKDELRSTERPLNCKCLEKGQESLHFLSANSEVLLSLDGGRECLLVVTTPHFERLQGKRMARFALNSGNPLPLEEILRFILQHKPVMDIHLSNLDTVIRIDSHKFDFTCLGEANKQSIALNFPAILKEIRRFSSAVYLDTGFGENKLPFLNCSGKGEKEHFIREFNLYSNFISLAHQKGLFIPTMGNETATAAFPLPKISLLEDMGGITWIGPLLSSTESLQQDGKGSAFSAKTGKNAISSLPPPHAEVRGRIHSTFAGPGSLKEIFLKHKGIIKNYGPPFFLFPLILLNFFFIALAYFLESPGLLLGGLVPLGLILFSHSIVLLRRKRTIENCPTSKIRSAAMGQVEVKGYARQKYLLRSPCTYTDCVYYSYKVYEEEWIKDGYRYELKERGDSGRISFYLEDDTGKILVLPGKAIIHAGVTQTMLGDPLTKIFGERSSFSNRNRKIVETIIPVGQFLYIIGFAHPMRKSDTEKKKRFIEKLRTLKADSQRLKRYDTDGDGKISPEEWDAAREDMEEEVLLEGLSSQADKDYAAIGEHPSGGLFFISDRREEGLVKSMIWRIPFFFVLSLVCIMGGVYYLLQLEQNKALLLELRHLLWP